LAQQETKEGISIKAMANVLEKILGKTPLWKLLENGLKLVE